MIRNTLRLTFCYLKIIDISDPRYHPKLIRHILKNNQKNKCVSIYEIIHHNENEDENENYIT